MKTSIACFLLFCSLGFGEEGNAPSRTDNLKVILEKTYLTSQSEPLLNMLAMEAIGESSAKIEAPELIQLLRTRFGEEETLAAFCAPYQAAFSDKEISELRQIHENPTWQKYCTEGMAIFQDNLQTLKGTFKELALQYVPEEIEAQAIAAADIIQVTSDNYHDAIEKASMPVILDVNASWCGPCRMMEPVFEELSGEYGDQIQFAKLDFDSQTEVAKKYNVSSLPTLLFFKPGQKKPVMRSVGYINKADFEAKITEFLKK